MTGPFVSVTTPFYNAAPHLAECIESVLCQSWRNFEYVLVNNASTDGSREIAALYAGRDPRIRLLDQPAFVGQVDNYNAALGWASPSAAYCKIVQADDWLFPECLERMVRVAERDPQIAIVGSYHLRGNNVLFSGMPIDTPVLEGRELCRSQLLARGYLMGNPTTLLYRADCVRERTPFFEPARFHEDTETCFDLLRQRRFGFVPQVLSFVRVSDDSITGAHKDDDWLAALYYTLVKRFGPEYLTAGEYRQLQAIVGGEYWRRLGQAALLLRDADYWSFHRLRLAEVDERIRWSRVAGGAARTALRALLNPRWATGEARAEMDRRASRDAHRQTLAAARETE